MSRFLNEPPHVICNLSTRLCVKFHNFEVRICIQCPDPTLFMQKCDKVSYTVKDSDLNFFWAPKLSAGGLNFGLDSQYGNWNISSLNSPLRGILYSMVWRCNLRVVKVNIAFSCRSFMVRRLMFRFGLKFITANLLFMFNRMIVCVCQEHKP